MTLLEHEGYQTVEARDGADGLAAVRTQRPQLVMSDILMPTMDGYEFVRQLRAEPGAGATPVIFHTAHYHEREAHNLAKICRVERVIPKPSSALSSFARPNILPYAPCLLSASIQPIACNATCARDCTGNYVWRRKAATPMLTPESESLTAQLSTIGLRPYRTAAI